MGSLKTRLHSVGQKIVIGYEKHALQRDHRDYTSGISNTQVDSSQPLSITITLEVNVEAFASSRVSAHTIHHGCSRLRKRAPSKEPSLKQDGSKSPQSPTPKTAKASTS